MISHSELVQCAILTSEHADIYYKIVLCYVNGHLLMVL